MTTGAMDGKRAIITGAGSGIGRAACDVFAAAGAHVVAVDLHEPTEAAAAVGGTAFGGDVSDPALWDRIVADGPVDVCYLNAGLYGHQGPIAALDLDVYRRTIDANITGVVLGTRAVVPAMEANGGGAIVVTASVAGIVAFEGNPLYTLTKQAVAGFVRAVATELTPLGITIDAVCPGVVETPMTKEAMGLDELPESIKANLLSPTTIAEQALDLAVSEGTGRCRAVRERAAPIDWTFPTWRDLAFTEA